MIQYSYLDTPIGQFTLYAIWFVAFFVLFESFFWFFGRLTHIETPIAE